MTLDDYLFTSSKTSRELVVELYADGLSVADIAVKFDFTKRWVLAILKPYMPTDAELDAFKRSKFKKTLKKQNR